MIDFMYKNITFFVFLIQNRYYKKRLANIRQQTLTSSLRKEREKPVNIKMSISHIIFTLNPIHISKIISQNQVLNYCNLALNIGV